MPSDNQHQADLQHDTAVLDSINEGVFTVDLDWRITEFNRAAERITGVPADQAIGSACCDVFRASICETSCALRRTMTSGKPVLNAEYPGSESEAQAARDEICAAAAVAGTRTLILPLELDDSFRLECP